MTMSRSNPNGDARSGEVLHRAHALIDPFGKSSKANKSRCPTCLLSHGRPFIRNRLRKLTTFRSMFRNLHPVVASRGQSSVPAVRDVRATGPCMFASDARVNPPGRCFRIIGGFCILLFLLASLVQTLHHHGPNPRYGGGEHDRQVIQATSFNDSHESDAICPLCEAMQTTIPSVHCCAVPFSPAQEKVLFEPWATSESITWPFDLFSRPPPEISLIA